MKDYLLLFRGGINFQAASPETIQKAMMNWKTWMDDLAKQGRLGGSNRLIAGGSVIKGDKKLVMDGPFAEGKEIVSGYLGLKAKDLQDAIATAKDCPILTFDSESTVEVREVAPREIPD